MIYFCADDYGISKESNYRIEKCLDEGVLNKISVLPNGELTDLKQLFSSDKAKLSLHLNLVEGRPLSNPSDVSYILSKQGFFKYSFIGLFFLSIFGNRKKLQKQLYNEIKNQIDFWKKNIGENVPLSIDSHQHTHAIPLVFKTLIKVIKDEGLKVESIRIPAEPIVPFILTPSLYFSYKPVGIVKQWLLKFLTFINGREIKKSGIDFSYFMGVMFSGNVTEDKIKKLLPRYLKIAKKHGKDIEIAFHPGYMKNGEKLIEGYKTGFKKFYFSPLRYKEYETLINFKF